MSAERGGATLPRGRPSAAKCRQPTPGSATDTAPDRPRNAATNEIYAGVSADVSLSPTVKWFYDCDEADGSYILFDVNSGTHLYVSFRNEDGSWGDKYKAAETSLALMAFMVKGYMPEQPPYGGAMSKGVDFLLKAAREGGGYMGDSMYEHGLATLALIHRDNYDTLLLSTGDSDLLDAVSFLADHGKRIELVVFQQVGFGLAVAIVLDATVDALDEHPVAVGRDREDVDIA